MNRFKSTAASQESNEELVDVTMNTQLDGRNLLDEIPGQTPQKSSTVGRSSASADDSNFRLLQQATASTHHNVTELIDNVGANLGSEVHVKVDVVEDQLDDSVASGNLVIISDGGQVIDGSNQSSDNESDWSLISEQQTRNVRKSKQKVSTSGIRSSNRKQIQSTVFDYDQSNQVNGDKRKAKTESSEAAKRIKPGNDDEIQQEDEGADKYQIVTLELNCTEPGCERILNTFEMWKEQLWTCHGFVPYKHLKDNVRHNQHGQTEYPCTECNVLPKFQRSLNEHWRNFHLRGKFECSVCAFVANFRSEVKSHQQLIHRTRKFQCTHQGCDKAFKNKSELERHVRVHSGERPFKCTWDNCEFTFDQLCVATRHVRMQHFRLPQTVREQTELNIIDERDPMDYVQIEN